MSGCVEDGVVRPGHGGNMYFLRIHVFKIRQKKAMILDEKEGLRHGSLRSDAMKTGYGAPFPEKFCGRVKRPL